MKVVCSYCQAHIRDKAPTEDARVTHGICQVCEDHFTRQLEGLALGAYLDDFPFPVGVFDSNARIVAANQQLADMLGKPNRELAGLLGGEAFECSRARLPGGCGQTVHCQTCAIRKAIEHTAKTGEQIHRRRAFVDRIDGGLDVLVSSCRAEDGLVKIVIDSVCQ